MTLTLQAPRHGGAVWGQGYDGVVGTGCAGLDDDDDDDDDDDG